MKANNVFQFLFNCYIWLDVLVFQKVLYGIFFFFIYKFNQYRSYLLVMVDLHDLFSSLLYTGIMGFIQNFGGETVIEVFFGMKYIVHSSRIAQLHFKLKRGRKHHLYARLPFQWSSGERAFKVCIFSEPKPESAKVIQQVPLSRNNMTMIITIVSVVCSTLLLVVGIVAIVCCRRWNLRHKKFANVKRVIVMRPVSRCEATLTSF